MDHSLPASRGRAHATCSCGPGPIVQSTIGTKQIQGRLHPLPSRFPPLKQLESQRRFLPRFVDRGRQPTPVAALPLGSVEGAAGFLSPFPEPLHSVPEDSQDAPGCLLGVEDVEPVLQGNLVGLAAWCCCI